MVTRIRLITVVEATEGEALIGLLRNEEPLRQRRPQWAGRVRDIDVHGFAGVSIFDDVPLSRWNGHRRSRFSRRRGAASSRMSRTRCKSSEARKPPDPELAELMSSSPRSK